MATNFFPKIAVAAAGAVLSLAAIEATPATAATIKYDLTLNFFDTGEEASGSFSYDDSTIDLNEPFGVGLTD
ncbi:MAG: hypothetical protein LDL41_25520, partial [Coleofasciculus sp. S288]|nr:hypothetical protein [Coleofasciculus sp. S288]